jgi:glycosyltransferase involved in cell wall biosynthesis
MRIAFLSVSGQIGGSEVMLLQVLRQLRASRPDWTLLAVLPGEGALSARIAALGIETAFVPMPAPLRRLGEWAANGHSRMRLALRLARAVPGLPRYQSALARTLAAFDPDVIHSNGFKAHIVSARIARGRAALVWHMHEYVSGRPITRLLVRHYARRCDQIVANSMSVAGDVRGIAGAVVDVRVIHNGVDLERFAPAGPSADLDRLSALPPAAEGTVRAGLVGTFSRWKGHETFLRAIAALPRTATVRAYVVGGALYETDGSQYSLDELQALASSLGLHDRVGFTGVTDTPEDAMRALDIVVHASTEPEAFGLVIAEAMACGRAVVTSATGGSAELIRDGEDAVTHRPSDHADLASSLMALASDGPRRRRIGTAARASAEARFDARRLGEEFAGVYERALAARTGR